MQKHPVMKKIFLLLFASALAFQGCNDDEPETRCTTYAIIRDLTGLDGCGFVFELADGRRLEPHRTYLFCGTPPLPKEITEDPLYNFELVDGKLVKIGYRETGAASICMAGPVVKITCIEEVTNTQD